MASWAENVDLTELSTILYSFTVLASNIYQSFRISELLILCVVVTQKEIKYSSEYPLLLK